MVEEIEYKKAKGVKDKEIEIAFVTKIKPRPPFYLFVPSFEEIPENVREENKEKSFALGDFFDTDEEAIEKVKEAGYDKEQMKILEKQSYLKLKKKLEEVV